MTDKTKEVRVRSAVLEDTKLIAGFQLAMAQETESLTLDLEKVTLGVEAVFKNQSLGKYYVAEIEGKVVACLLTTYEWSEWRNSTVLWIQSVYVLPEVRKNGVYSKMYRYLQEMVNISKDYAGIRLYVDKTNARAQQVYEKMGMNGEHYQLYEWMVS